MREQHECADFALYTGTSITWRCVLACTRNWLTRNSTSHPEPLVDAEERCLASVVNESRPQDRQRAPAMVKDHTFICCSTLERLNKG